MASEPFITFDVETAKVLPAEANPTAHLPLGIAVAACRLPSGEVRYWHAGTAETPGPQLARDEAARLVDDLADLTKDGTPLVTWNGAAFDFQVLAGESGRWADCARLAWGHQDLMFHFFCVQGYGVSLEAVGKPLGLSKAAGLTGSEAPAAWARGEHARVKAYLAGDVSMLADIYQAALRDRGLSWVTQRGKVRRWAAPRILTVAEAVKLPKPDTSWMDRPRSRESLYEWAVKHLPSAA